MDWQHSHRNNFPVTDWSLVHAAGAPGDAHDSSAALEELLRRYEHPMRTHVLSRFRCQEQVAQDLVQGFILEVVLKKRLFGKAKAAKGYQFRAFLARALENYAISEFRKESSQKRAPAGGFESLDEFLERGECGAGAVASSSFDLNWAKAVITDALRRMEAECAASGQHSIWGVFECRLTHPILEGATSMPYGDLVKQFGFSSPREAENALTTGKRKFKRALRSVIAEYVEDATAIEVELRELQMILANASSFQGER
jgi:DNA-directed RNA polymerase specialized sigma24 family protein